MAKRDNLTTDMFTVPVPVAPVFGALNIDLQLRGMLSALLKACPLTRNDVAARMSELTGDTITKHQLDAWTAESREGWRFPCAYLPALEVAVETHGLLAWLADLRGARLLVGPEAIDAEIGRLERMREDAARRIKSLKSSRS